MFVTIIIIIIIIIIFKNNSVTPPGSIIWLLARSCWSQAQMKEEGIIPGTETWYKLKRLVKKRFEKHSNKKSNAIFLRLSEITKRKKGKEKKGKNEKEKKNHETTQQHNAVVLNDIYEKKIKKKKKKKLKIKVKTEKKKKNKQKKHTNKKRLTIQNEERAKQTTYMAEQKEQKQYRG